MEKLLELFNRFSLLVKEAFNDDPRFLTSRDKVSSQTHKQRSFYAEVGMDHRKDQMVIPLLCQN